MSEDGSGRFAAARAPVSLRDAIAALAELGPFDAAARDTVFELLALERSEDATPKPSPRPSVLPPRPESAPNTAAPPMPPPQLPLRPPTEDHGQPLEATLTRAERSAPPKPAWLLDQGEPLPRAHHAAPAPRPPTIFAPLEVRGIYTAALSTWVAEGDLDLDRAVDELAAARPLHSIPRLPLRTLRSGVQLLLDAGPSMAPFAADLRGVEEDLGQLLSGSQLERLFFLRCPTRGVRDALHGRRRVWRAPPRGVPLLVVSDFGVTSDPFDDDAATVAEWRRFALELRADGHICVGLIPFASSRWPRPLSELIGFVHWSEHTSAGDVDRALRPAQRRIW